MYVSDGHFRLCEASTMGEKSRAVLDAADMWLVAMETRELLGTTPSVLEELDEMKEKLAMAVRAWRLAGGRASAYV
jgi:hypothetical protein